MATPIGHSLAGYVVYIFAAAKDRDRLNLILLCIVMANAPDLDFLPGIFLGKPAMYHQGITHSLGFALMVSLVAAVLYSIKGKSFSVTFNLCFFSYFSHLVIDFFGPDQRLPYGIPLFWPISVEHFISPVSLFLGVHHVRSTSASTLEWIDGIFDPYNLGAICLEVLLIAPFILLGKRYGKGSLG